MIEQLMLNGKLDGSFEGEGLKIEFQGQSIKADFQSLKTLQTLKDLFYPKIKAAKDDPKLQAFFKAVDINIFLEGEHVARIGKNAQSNFISNMLGLPYFEVVNNSRMSDLMGLM